MSIKLAILGILSWKPATGYDVKKIMEDSLFMHWSGNNNQIYRSMVQLLDEELVTNEVLHQDSSPSKKMYTITEKGLAELKQWVLSAPQLPESKNSFLNQLAWADQLSSAELNELLEKYEEEISMHVILLQEKTRRGLDTPTRTQRETHIWNRIHEHIITSYKNEWLWVQNLRKELQANNIRQEETIMNHELVQKNGAAYVEITSAVPPIATEQDAISLITLNIENDTPLLLLHAEALSDDFFQLRTRVAGNILQKLVNYQVKTALLLHETFSGSERFKEMIQEANKGNHFRVFTDKNEAEAWLIR